MWYEADRKRSRYYHLADYLHDIQVDKELDVAENEIEQLKAELAETRADWSEMVEQRNEARKDLDIVRGNLCDAMEILLDFVRAIEPVHGYGPTSAALHPAYEKAKKFLGLDEHEDTEV